MKIRICMGCLKVVDPDDIVRRCGYKPLSPCCGEVVVSGREAGIEAVRRLHLVRTTVPGSAARLWYELPVIQAVRERMDRVRERERAERQAAMVAPVDFGRWLFELGADMARMRRVA
jgi:hypothetical protein